MIDQRNISGRGWVRRGAALLAAVIGLAPAVAAAQDKTFYLDRLRIGGAPEDDIGVWRPEMGKETRFFGQLAVGFTVNPLRTDNYVDDLNKSEQIPSNPVTAQLITYLNAGVEILDRAAIQLSFPLIAYQASNRTDYTSLGIDSTTDVQSTAPGDPRLDGRIILFRTEDRAVKLGLNAAVFLPTGNEFSFAGDSATSGSFSLAGEYDFKKVFVTVNVGVAIRPTVLLNELTVGTELTYGAGAYVPLRDDTIRVGGEVFGSFGATADTLGELDATPVEWLVGAKMFPITKSKAFYFGAGAGTRLSGGYAPDFRGVLLAGGTFTVSDRRAESPDFKYEIAKEKDTDEDGYPDVIDLCPEDKEDGVAPKPSDGCPNLPDRDGDGIPDVVDRCPDVPEDLDGTDDRDGCPEEDADQDGIPDSQDQCPKEPGQAVADNPSKNGCPYYIRRISGSAEIQILKQVEFEFDKWTILPKSFPILDEVVRLLKANPEIKLVDIEGHTDNQGTVEYNDKLAQNRAYAVRDYIIRKGIQGERMTAAGFGSRRPLDTNDTPEGRQKNRRVEFHIKSQTIEGR